MKKILLILSAFVLVNGCYYDVADELYPDTGSTNCDTTVSGYAARIAPMMTANCAISGCHVAGAQTPDLSNYTDVAANSALVNERTVIIKDMPPSGPMSACDIQALEKWIDNGSLNN